MLGYSFVPIIAGYIRGRILYRLERSLHASSDGFVSHFQEVVISLGLFDYIDVLGEVWIPKGIFQR